MQMLLLSESWKTLTSEHLSYLWFIFIPEKIAFLWSSFFCNVNKQCYISDIIVVSEINNLICRYRINQQESSNFIRGGSRISQRRHQSETGCQPFMWPKIPENCMKMKKIGPEARSKFYYVDPPLFMFKVWCNRFRWFAWSNNSHIHSCVYLPEIKMPSFSIN